MNQVMTELGILIWGLKKCKSVLYLEASLRLKEFNSSCICKIKIKIVINNTVPTEYNFYTKGVNSIDEPPSLPLVLQQHEPSNVLNMHLNIWTC